MSRGSLALVIWPKLVDVLNSRPAPTGALKFGWLKKSNTSSRNCSRHTLAKRKFLLNRRVEVVEARPDHNVAARVSVCKRKGQLKAGCIEPLQRCSWTTVWIASQIRPLGWSGQGFSVVSDIRRQIHRKRCPALQSPNAPHLPLAKSGMDPPSRIFQEWNLIEEVGDETMTVVEIGQSLFCCHVGGILRKVGFGIVRPRVGRVIQRFGPGVVGIDSQPPPETLREGQRQRMILFPAIPRDARKTAHLRNGAHVKRSVGDALLGKRFWYVSLSAWTVYEPIYCAWNGSGRRETSLDR